VPLLTVVTVCRNAAAHLSATLASVQNQTARAHFEYLIVDGASTDDTLDIIQAAAASGAIDRWVSEKDAGIYDAMNKAVGLARGEWVLFMNSADVFETADAIERILPELSAGGGDSGDAEHDERASSSSARFAAPGAVVSAAAPAPDLVYGDCIMVYPDGSPVYDKARKPEELRHRMICSHQSLFARRSLLRARPFNTKYTICADYDFLLGAWIAGAQLHHVPIPVGRVQLEYYSFPQITVGHRQKRKAAMARLGYGVRWRFDFGWLALAVKHVLKRILGRATLRKVDALPGAGASADRTKDS